jgi:hypothetical protein
MRAAIPKKVVSMAPKTMSAEHDLIDLPPSLKGSTEIRLMASRVGPTRPLYEMANDRLPIAITETVRTLMKPKSMLSLARVFPAPDPADSELDFPLVLALPRFNKTFEDITKG